MNSSASAHLPFPKTVSNDALSILQAFIGIDLWLERQETRLSEILWEGTRDWILDRNKVARSKRIPLPEYDAENYFAAAHTLLALCRKGDCFPLDAYIDTAARCEVPPELIEPLRAVSSMPSDARQRVLSEAGALLAQIIRCPFCKGVAGLLPQRQTTPQALRRTL